MKEETKKTVKWLINHLNHYRVDLISGKTGFGLTGREQEDKNSLLAIELLNNLPILEKYLRKGGYIQDKNGEPCCNGDKIKNGEKEVGILYWSKLEYRFYFKKNDTLYLLRRNFEKVEK